MRKTLKNLTIIILVILGISCSDDQLNKTIRMQSPKDGTKSLSLDKAPILKWESDGENFDIYCDTHNPPITKLNTEKIQTKEFTLYKLKGNTKYYWKIVAENKDIVTENKVWSFTTAKRNNNSWYKRYNVPRYGFRGKSIIKTKDGGIIIIEATISGQRYAWKLDINGEEVWKHDLTMIPKNSTALITNNDNGGYTILHRYMKDNSYTFVFFNENCQAQKSVTQILKPRTSICSAIQTKDGGFILIGQQGCKNSSNNNIWYAKTDLQGRIVWEETFGDEYSNEVPKAIIETGDNGYAISGSTTKNIFTSEKNTTREYALFIKTDLDGYVIFNKQGTFGNKYDQIAETLISTSNSDIIMGCNTNSLGSSYCKLLIQKINKEGKVQRFIFNNDNQELIKQIIETQDGGFAILATTSNETKGKTDILLIKTNNKFEKLWSKKYGGSGVEKAISLIQTFDGGYAILGSSTEENNKEYGWFIKTDDEGLVDLN
ncbi:MAG: hypothetical protein WBG43_11585 [Marinifilaceae bacterium]